MGQQRYGNEDGHWDPQADIEREEEEAEEEEEEATSPGQ
jgi:hypothetical protein